MQLTHESLSFFPESLPLQSRLVKNISIFACSVVAAASHPLQYPVKRRAPPKKGGLVVIVLWWIRAVV